ncbi:MAG: PAS domain-containing sensor histidine kinase [Patescibacteria group bacterium]|nr:PAS domain-containing sensor histidine kinase [Patescibacteria group bacterium]
MGIKTPFLRNFLLIAIISVILGWISLNFFTKYQIERFFANEIQNRITETLRQRATEAIPEDAFKGNNYLKYRTEFTNFEKNITYPIPSVVSVYNKSGLAIYSNNDSIVGKQFTNPSLDNALEGKKIVSLSASNLNFFKSGFGNEEIDAYIPIYYGNSKATEGIIHLTFPLSHVVQNMNPFLSEIWIVSAIGISFLFSILFLFFRKASKAFVDNNRVLEERTNALKISKDQDEAILESVDEGLIMVNKNFQVITFNPKAEKMTGYDDLSIVFRHYRNILDLRDEDGKKLKEDYLKNALEQGIVIRKNSRDEVYLKNKDGKTIPISLIAAPIYNQKEGLIVGAVMTFIDASKEKELDKVKDEFVYVIAHEMGNPIFTVNGYLTMLLEGTFGKLTQKTKDSIKSALSANEQLSSLVADLLEMIRSESGQLKFDLEPCDINATVRDVVGSLRLKAKEKKIEIHFEEKKLPKVTSNPAKLKEVLTNLIDNAIKYSDPGKDITVSLDRVEDKVVANIKDNGFGMAEEEVTHLFEKFYRVPNEKASKISGTGLGLFIVKQLINKMGGEIWVGSEKGKGSTFSFSLKISG